MASNYNVVHCAVQVNGQLVTDLCTSIEWQGDYSNFSRSVSLSFMKAINCSPGDNVRLNIDDVEAFYGMAMSVDGDERTMTIEAVDNGIYLTKNRVNVGIVTKKPQDMTKELCSRYGVGCGSIATVDKAFNRKYMANTCADIIMDMYTMASKDNSKKYYPYFHANKLNILEFGSKTCYYAIDGNTAISMEFKESIQNMINTIYYYENSEDTKASKTFKNDDDVKKYGTFSDVTTDKLTGNKDLKTLEENASVTVIGDVDFITGRAVLVNLPNGLVGKFYITSDSHSIKAGVYTTKLDLSFDKVMDEKDIGDITYNKASDSDSKLEYEITKPTSNTDSGSNTVNKVPYKRVPAQFTAYYPDNSPMQGGFYAANGEKLNPSAKTCACPKTIPFGEIIIPEGINYPSVEGQRYKCNDRGGAIVIDAQGRYHIDILMASATAANNFGRRNGYAVIGGYYEQGNAPSYYNNQSTTATGAMKVFLDTLYSQIGVPYVWGGTSLGKGVDCSGLTYASAAKAGKRIGRTTWDQIKEGSSVSIYNAQRGDLIFFNSSSGSYCTHMGVVWENTLGASSNGRLMYLHAPNTGSKVRIDQLSSSRRASICGIRRLSFSTSGGSGGNNQQMQF